MPGNQLLFNVHSAAQNSCLALRRLFCCFQLSSGFKDPQIQKVRSSVLVFDVKYFLSNLTQCCTCKSHLKQPFSMKLLDCEPYLICWSARSGSNISNFLPAGSRKYSWSCRYCLSLLTADLASSMPIWMMLFTTCCSTYISNLMNWFLHQESN